MAEAANDNPHGLVKIKRALISVSNKKGLGQVGLSLIGYGIEILSTGGTATELRKFGISVKEVSTFTGFPELFGGRLKTLHPKIEGGLLYNRDDPEHVKEAQDNGIEPIDLLITNLYPFQEVIRKQDATLKEKVENIDIGGPTLLRAAAKNYKSVTVVSDIESYEPLMLEMEANNGCTTLEFRWRLMVRIFDITSNYDRKIFSHFRGIKVVR